MTNLEWATWILAGFTGTLMAATIIYAYLTYKMLKSSELNQKLLEEQNSIAASQNQLLKEQIGESQKQAEALNELSKAIREVGPSIIAAQTRKENQRELEEIRKKDNPQRRALTGRR
ncbi:MAG: hypothetical protein ABSE54_03320 [Smithella sp.]